MLKPVGSYEAKTKLPELLREVAAGHSFTITNRGKAIADLIPSKENSRSKARVAIANIKKIKKVKVNDATLKAMKEAGRK